MDLIAAVTEHVEDSKARGVCMEKKKSQMHFGVPGRSQGSVDGASLLPTLHLHPLGAIRAGSP